MSNSNPPFIIIGTGLAGYSLAREFRKLDSSSPILMITSDDGHSYSKPMLSTGFTKGKSAEDLSMANPGKMADQLNLSIRTYTDVTGIDPELDQIHIGSEIVAYKSLVLATGAKVNKLKFPGSDHTKVISINDLLDYRNFRNLLTNKEHVLIMGAGLIGCEYANDLLNGGYQVTVVDPSDSALNGLIPDFAGRALIQGLEQSGANVIMRRFVSEVSEIDEVLHATLDDGTQLKSDLIISAVGLKPNLDLAQSTGLECIHGIVTNNYLETSQSNIYALGDCAEIDGHVRLYVLPLMASARALAQTLHGNRTAVQFGTMPVATKTPACPVIVCPPAKLEGKWHIEQDDMDISARFKNKEGTLKGFVLTGDQVNNKQLLVKEMAGQ